MKNHYPKPQKLVLDVQTIRKAIHRTMDWDELDRRFTRHYKRYLHWCQKNNLCDLCEGTKEVLEWFSDGTEGMVTCPNCKGTGKHT